jgi:F-type H+-transporting ATPase subunit gamma
VPSTRDLRRRIRSVQGTQQITKAMKMVAAAKLRRAQAAITQARPYADTMARVLSSLASRTEHSHPLLETRESSRARLVVISSDKGLCGSFNANLLREASRVLTRRDRWESVDVVAIGRKASDFFRRRDWSVVHDERETMSKLTATDGERLGSMFTEAFTSGAVDEVWLLYNRFVSLIRQEITLERLLPIEPPEPPGGSVADSPPVDYLYEPDAATLLATLLPRHVEAQVQRCLYDSAAAEQSARMTSMDAATKNAGDMIDSLTLLYNRTRQAGITKELLEIVAGAQALAE